jgi:DNA primase
MPNSTTELIKEKLNIVDFLKGYLQLNAAGKNFKGLCPFHKEKSPSFMVSPDRQSWHCFGCGIGGDVFEFIMRYEHIEFSEALKILAEKAGVQLQRINPAEYKLAGLLYDLNEEAMIFFKKQLEASDEAKTYLIERKLKPETISEFDLGFAPNDFEALTLHFLNSGTAPEDLIRAGLTFKTERGLQMDRFRGRVMFPIRNHMGKVVGFTGRVLPHYDDGKMGKYVNSPETPIFNKSRLLYGFYKTKEFIREAGSAFLVEGQMDLLMSYQTGVKNVVASSGTAFTSDHLQALRRMTDKIIVSFDDDDAGRAAGEKVIDMAKANDFSVSVASFAPYKDPAEAAADNPKNFMKMVNEAKPAMEIYLDRYLPASGGPAGAAHDFSSRENISRLRTLLAKIKNISSPVERDFWMKQLVRRSGLDEAVLKEEAMRVAGDAPARTLPDEEVASPVAPSAFTRWELLAQKLLAVILNDNKFEEVNIEYIPVSHIRAYEVLKSGARRADDPAVDSILELILLQSEPMDDPDIQFLKDEVLREWTKEQRHRLIAEVKSAEMRGDSAALEELLGEMARLSNQGWI